MGPMMVGMFCFNGVCRSMAENLAGRRVAGWGFALGLVGPGPAAGALNR